MEHRTIAQLWLILRPALLLSAVFFTLFYLQYQPELHNLLRFERATFSSNLQQSISHAFIHLNLRHLQLNTAALLCLFILFNRAFQTLSWLLVLLISAVSSAAGMYFFSPNIDWVVGLSGALHGLAVYAILRSKAQPVWLLLIAGKIIAEQLHWFADLPFASLTSEWIAHDIVVDAHLWGAIGGLAYYLGTRSVLAIGALIEINRDAS
jgi:rhomboid family GlyGly-CTERM serine protease